VANITVSGEFADLSKELSEHAEALFDLMEESGALFEQEGADGIRYLCHLLDCTLYVPMLVTPALAGTFLELERKHQRPSNDQTVEAYVRDIDEDKWLETGEGIKFDNASVMQDGGHRCRAIQKAGRPIRTLVIFGLDPRAELNIDSGRSRTMANFLGMLGESNAQNLQSVVMRLVAWRKGYYVRPAKFEKRSRQEVLAYLKDNPEIREQMSHGAKLAKLVPGLSASAATLAEVIIRRTGRDADADLFFEQLATGGNMVPGHPVVELRTRLAEGARRRGRARFMWTLEEQLALIFSTWNRRDEEMVDQLKIPAKLNDQNFPVPKEGEYTRRERSDGVPRDLNGKFVSGGDVPAEAAPEG
jgi:hypothetical protein